MTDSEYRSIFSEHRDAVYRFAWRMLASPQAAEDVTQDSFLELLRSPGRYDSTRGSMRPYLLGVARNLVLKRWRAENRWTSLDDDTLIEEPPDAVRLDLAERVAYAVRSLPPLQREALVLAEYEELTLEEVAEAVEAEVGTVKSRLHRARENLRRTLAPIGRSTWNR